MVMIPRKKGPTEGELSRAARSVLTKNRLKIMRLTLEMGRNLVKTGCTPEEAFSYVDDLVAAAEKVGFRSDLSDDAWFEAVKLVQSDLLQVPVSRNERLRTYIQDAVNLMEGLKGCLFCEHTVDVCRMNPNCPRAVLLKALEDPDLNV